MVEKAGLCFEPEVRAPARFGDAVAECALRRARLPDFGELLAAHNVGGLGGLPAGTASEFTSSVTEVGGRTSVVGLQSGLGGAEFVDPQAEEGRPYRCAMDISNRR
jgi:hypothetical protein